MTETATLPLELFTHWLETGERGISSEAIVNKLTGFYVGQPSACDYPYDPSDFRRCERLLRAVPEAREHLNVVATKGPVWAGLVAEWDYLVELGEADVPDMFGAWAKGKATRLYDRMRDIRVEVSS
ncbi:hypothetical protein C1M55_12010 [Rhodococcus qingshengii]|uniref:hypothetical protein n=1 Tax=Rhodococcus TaxID=1827 RepID=UPI000976EB27|nr:MULTISPECIES: hypothetical protein [Rhodococcus]AUS31696.1 hypothetical protein C1M55_11640 [Rhodococcus qingshengii]AUS31761.1 hypothetical protein C1M55_12010 [Rhodococcus qingshengii]MCC4304214.1 hypothetical protein [Rhodococcus sp. 3-2]OMQ36719.1 hypothetical protein BK799_08985 [Rhodococcus sp. D-1]